MIKKEVIAQTDRREIDDILAKRIREPNLDYIRIPAGLGVHSIHTYPAMFHPKLVNKFIKEYTKKNELVIDPFLGSGVSAVESSTLSRRFYGFDVNPLAVLIARVRSTPIQKSLLNKQLGFIIDNYSKQRGFNPNFMNIDYWFSRERIKDISKLIRLIDTIENEDVRNFFRVCLSETIKKVSKSNNNEFKLVRGGKPCKSTTVDLFKEISSKNIDTLTKFYDSNRNYKKPRIERLNLLEDVINIKEESASLLITSPPYGDSQTTVAYGQYSRLSLQWLGLDWRHNKKYLGHKKINIENALPSDALYIMLDKIKRKDIQRAKHVYSFYNDLFKSLQRIHKKVKKNGFIVMVVGNRNVKGYQLPTDVICVEFLDKLGFKHEKTYVRNIGNKRMPSKNSPTNIIGKTVSTMKSEYIIIARGNTGELT
ncbi:MAG: DNA methyltransferase [candidate division WOR-3 bacterium]|nr:DNA methyltransferase [candidate division WOR-3 bacterium]